MENRKNRTDARGKEVLVAMGVGCRIIISLYLSVGTVDREGS
jgi:hypothetical protein